MTILTQKHTTTKPTNIDFKALAKELLPQALSLLQQWFPAGVLKGREFCIGNLQGDAGITLKVNIDTGLWSDFATGESGGDLISLYAAIRGLSQTEAKNHLTGQSSGEVWKSTRASGSSPTPRKPAPAKKRTTHASLDAAKAVVIRSSDHGQPSAIYEYQDAESALTAQVIRWDFTNADGSPGKDFRPISLTPEGWIIGALTDNRPLYNLPEILARSTQRVFIVEGEKAAEAAQTTGVLVTTNQSGSKAAGKTDWAPLTNRDVFILPDNDNPGEEYAQEVKAILLKQNPAATVKIVRLPGLPPKGDIVEFIDMRGGPDGVADELYDMADQAEDDAQADDSDDDRQTPAPTTEPRHTPAQPDAQAAGAPLILDPADPLPTAEMFHAKYHTAADGTALLRHHQGEFLEYRDGCYRSIGADGIRSCVYKYTRQAPGFKPTQHKINIIIDALKAHADLDATISAPAWLDGRTDYLASEMLAHKTGILHLPTKTNLPATPQFFTRSALDYEYDPQAPSPTKWLMFLKSVWPNDQESIDTLQEVFGYLMGGDTSQQKIFLILGPKRSGKGTIGRLFTSLRGKENIVASMLANLSSNFGTAPLIGKPVCIIPDARLGTGSDQAIITERLLSLSGEDTMTIDRKYLSAWTGRPNTRILIMSNETPRINDSSGALASRFIVLETSESFLGREEHGLDDKLKAELPGILNWAIDGYQRLASQGRFHQPSSAADTIEELEELGSPVGSFIKDCCIVGVGKTIPVAELYQAWCKWCSDQGRDHPSVLSTFSRDLKSCEPKIKTIRKQSGLIRVSFFEGITL